MDVGHVAGDKLCQRGAKGVDQPAVLRRKENAKAGNLGRGKESSDCRIE